MVAVIIGIISYCVWKRRRDAALAMGQVNPLDGSSMVIINDPNNVSYGQQSVTPNVGTYGGGQSVNPNMYQPQYNRPPPVYNTPIPQENYNPGNSFYSPQHTYPQQNHPQQNYPQQNYPQQNYPQQTYQPAPPSNPQLVVNYTSPQKE